MSQCNYINCLGMQQESGGGLINTVAGILSG